MFSYAFGQLDMDGGLYCREILRTLKAAGGREFAHIFL
jgi:hypothetical protein